MPKVSFSQKEEVVQWWRMEVDVPQEVVDEGDDAVRKWILEESQGGSACPDYLEIEHSDVKESFIDVDEIEIA
jgi:hypothetical protein